MTTAIPACTCGHPVTDHTDDGAGACHEPTGRCGCPTYTELCPLCRHGKPSHAGINGQCTVIKQATRQPCGCVHYVVAPT